MSAFPLRLADDRTVSLLKPSVMGVINASPDSFYRPYRTRPEIFKTIEKMVESGVDIIDVGGEATNLSINLENSPSAEEQIDRIGPLIEYITQFPVLISVDASLPEVMREAIKMGAHIINDQRGLQLPGAMAAAVELMVPVALMHFFTTVRRPGNCSLQELLAGVKADLWTAVMRCQTAGIHSQRIIIDPGFGQGNYCKNAQENYYLLAHLSELAEWGFPVLTGWSRKSMIGETLGKVPPQERLYGSIAAAVLAAMQGASIIRVHDVPETIDAIKIFRAMRDEKKSEKNGP